MAGFFGAFGMSDLSFLQFQGKQKLCACMLFCSYIDEYWMMSHGWGLQKAKVVPVFAGSPPPKLTSTANMRVLLKIWIGQELERSWRGAALD